VTISQSLARSKVDANDGPVGQAVREDMETMVYPVSSPPGLKTTTSTVFLNAILSPRLRITRITIQNPFLAKDSEDDKVSVLDIRAVDEHGRVLNIEMRTTLSAGISQRLTYYTACLYGSQMNEGDHYTSLRLAISICVLTKPMFPDASGLHLEFQLRTESGLLLND
jgi:predicted transposase/invertase (TIGR01784 family)